MIITNRNTTVLSTAMLSFATFLAIALPSTSQAEGWELRTTYKEVPGTREIESGNIEKGIALSRLWLPRISYRLKVPALTNLCVGHILIRELEQAEIYCDQAVASRNQRAVTHNNRGVLRALQGDYAAAQGDFSVAADAGCINSCDETDVDSGNLPRHVALRNLKRIGSEAVAFETPTDADRMTAQKDQ